MNAKLCDLCKNVIVHPVPVGPLELSQSGNNIHRTAYLRLAVCVSWSFNGDICRSCFFELTKDALQDELKQPQ